MPLGRYLHWDELRRRPAPAGLSHDDWWTAVGIARRPLLQGLPLLDKQGKPFVFATPAPVAIDLHHIDRDAAGQIRSSAGAPVKEDSQRYLIGSLIEEAITSSQLEGASTTRQVAAAMLRSGRRPRNVSERMIFNNYRAMEHLRSLRDAPLTPEGILELHRMLTEETLDNPEDAGRLRQGDDVVVVDVRDNTPLAPSADLDGTPGAAAPPLRFRQCRRGSAALRASGAARHPAAFHDRLRPPLCRRQRAHGAGAVLLVDGAERLLADGIHVDQPHPAQGAGAVHARLPAHGNRQE